MYFFFADYKRSIISQQGDNKINRDPPMVQCRFNTRLVLWYSSLRKELNLMIFNKKYLAVMAPLIMSVGQTATVTWQDGY